jgi:signal transduction histidine kinase
VQVQVKLTGRLRYVLFVVEDTGIGMSVVEQ